METRTDSSPRSALRCATLCLTVLTTVASAAPPKAPAPPPTVAPKVAPRPAPTQRSYSVRTAEDLLQVPRALRCTAVQFEVPSSELQFEDLIGLDPLPRSAWIIDKPIGQRIALLGQVPSTEYDRVRGPYRANGVSATLTSPDAQHPISGDPRSPLRRRSTFLSVAEVGDHLIIQVYLERVTLVKPRDLAAAYAQWKVARKANPAAPEPIALPPVLTLTLQPLGTTYTLRRASE